MRFPSPFRGLGVVCAGALATFVLASSARAATIAVPSGGDLQGAINAAQAGDVIVLEPGAVYSGNFVLPNKAGMTVPIVIRSAAPDSALPPAGVRVTPAYAAWLPKIKSPNNMPALRTATGAHHWTVMLVEFPPNKDGYGDIISLGAGDSTQTDYSQVPYALTLDRIYVHGDPLLGQKRGIGLHSRDTVIVNSYVSDCKAVGQDSQAISGFNGPGNFLLENNYLEGAGENVLFGGADPVIPNLVTTNITFRRNHLYKPLAWRDPIVATPASIAATAAPGAGSLAPGTYYYVVAARRMAGQTNKANSAVTQEVSATLTVTGAVIVSWSPVAGAMDYLVYGRTAGAENVYWQTTASSFTDTGTAGSAGTPAKATKWSVKNLFELKNAQDVLVEGNLMENDWVADQSYPLAITPRNQNGGASWVVVQRVVIQNNYISHTAGGANILGRDNNHPSQQTNHITIENNVFDDMISASWGTGARPITLGDGADTVTIDHNTIDTTDSGVVWLYGGSATAPTPNTNFVFTNNMSRHSTYGIYGSNYATGMSAINAYLPGSIIRRNVLAGGRASLYPVDNFFPTVTAWEGDFVDFPGADYRLLDSSSLKRASIDGTDVGADISKIAPEVAIALGGDNRSVPGATPVQILTDALPNAMLGQPYNQTLQCTGGTGPCAWALVDASMPSGIAFDSATATIGGTATSIGGGSVTVRAFDPAVTTNAATKTLNVTVDAAPFSITVSAAASGQVGSPLSVTPASSGGVAPVVWSLSPALPDGLTFDAFSGAIGGTPSRWGTSALTLSATDGANRTASPQPLTLTIAPTPLSVATTALPSGAYNVPYAAMLSAAGGTGNASWTATGGNLPPGLSLSVDGTVTGTPAGAGTFSFSVKATDTGWPGYEATATVSLTIDAPKLSILLPAVPPARVGQPFSWTPTASGAMSTVSWSIAGGSLPAGLTLAAGSGTISGTPTAYGTFTVTIRAIDGGDATRSAAGDVTLVVAPPQLLISTTTLASATVNVPYSTRLTASGGTGTTTWTLASGTLPGLMVDAGGVLSGTPTAAGTFAFTVSAVDAGWPGNAAVQSLTLVVVTPPTVPLTPEIVLYASKAKIVGTAWSKVADSSAAGGYRIANPDLGAAKLSTALATPASYIELTFTADAKTPYHLWLRGKAQNNAWANDSVFVQFAGAVNALGTAEYRIGTTSATWVGIEDANNAGLSGWGWQDDAFGALADPIYFAQSGTQTIRIQAREDGLSIDQIVLSSVKYSSAAPGALKNDTVILRETAITALSLGSPSVDPQEVVLYAADATVVGASWLKLPDSTAAGGTRVANPDLGAPKLATALASPASFIELKFKADAGVAYHLWIRGKAQNDGWANDSVFVQFSGTVTANGAAINRIGTTAATWVGIEDATNAGLSGWGWQDDAFDALAPPIYFAQSGDQTLRIQAREDGLSIDQVVISAGRYLTTSPGALKNDTTIVAK